MKFYYITFRSVTYAQRGEKLMHREGLHCSLLRTPKWMEAQGCGYSLQLWTREAERAVALLRENGIPFRKVYVQQTGGELEEMAL